MKPERKDKTMGKKQIEMLRNRIGMPMSKIHWHDDNARFRVMARL